MPNLLSLAALRVDVVATSNAATKLAHVKTKSDATNDENLALRHVFHWSYWVIQRNKPRTNVGVD